METADLPLSVLVVDGGDDAAESTAALLALHGHSCRCAGCGEDALAAAAADPPDVLLVELALGGMDGCEVARRVRVRAGAKRPLLVALTGCGRDEDRRRSAAAGFDLHLVKPAEPAVLVGLLDRFRRVIARPDGCPDGCGGVCHGPGG